ncbi:MAG: IgA Peptidase M64 [Bryobacterales bacterium]|nr:IgA Peptidase M64 [Bryobacterales bacterium]
MVFVVPLLLGFLLAAPATLRLDYFHTGSASEERFALDSVVQEGAWPGPPAKTVDTSNLGRYLFEVRDAKSRALLYSRGFASIFGEWETTVEAHHRNRTLHESLRFPAPSVPVKVTIFKRDAKNKFKELWFTEIDPRDRAVDRAAPPANVKVWAVQQNGPSAEKVDLLLIGDGYTAQEMDKWHADARRLTAALFATPPFRERQADFNVWAIDVPADESGVSRPSERVYRRSPVRAAYDAFGSERYVLTFDNQRLREIAAAAPYEFVEIVVNGRKYGGGGIHNLYATVASDNAWTPYVFVHEFGHHFAGLADEYYTSDVAYQAAAARLEPWEPNVTADPARPKWNDLIARGTLRPTPWAKAEFEAYQKDIQARRKKIRAENRPEAEMEALFAEEHAVTTKLLSPLKAVGVYEGAMYEAKGYYRAEADCIMFTRSSQFCSACRRAINNVIDLYTNHAAR